VRIPSFSRQSSADTTVEDRPTAPTTPTTQRDDRLPQRTSVANRTPVAPRSGDSAVAPPRDVTTATIPAVRTERPAATTEERPTVADQPVEQPVTRKPRASFAATLGLILGVGGALLVLSGPMMGYGMGVAGLGLLFSAAGLMATRKQHVAGKTDALIGLALSIAAIVVGILALTGQLYWLGTDMQPATDLRQWLDTQFAARF
jgi:hypothetical protein